MSIRTSDDEIPIPNDPHKALWAAVLVQAFKDLQGLTFGNPGSVRTSRANAISWVNSDRVDYIGSFRYVCEVLSLDPGVVRKVFREGKKDRKLLIVRKQGIMKRIKATDPAIFESMTALEIASMFGTTKSNIYNIMSLLRLKYKHRHWGGNHRTQNV